MAPSVRSQIRSIRSVFRLSIFVLAVFVGYYVVWSVTPALHTPLMSVMLRSREDVRLELVQPPDEDGARPLRRAGQVRDCPAVR